MEKHKRPLLQCKAIILWVQQTKWEDLNTKDFHTIVPVPHFNTLTKPIVLPEEAFYYIHNKVGEAFEMYFQFKHMGIKPWEVKGKVYVEDLRVLAMLEILMEDRAKYAKKKAENDAEMKRTADKLNAESKAKGKTGYRRRSR